MILQYALLKEINIDDTHAISDCVVFIDLLAVSCFFISNNMKYYLPRQGKNWNILITSLNSISSLTGSQPEKARHMITHLSEFLRGTLRKEEDLWNTLEEEIQHLRLYLDIEKVRFGHRLQTEVISTNEAMSLKLPAML